MALAGGRCVLMGPGSELAYPETSGQPREGTSWSEARRPGSLGLGLGGLYDLGALVVPARRTNAMGNTRFGTVGARDEVRDRHLVVVGAPHVALRSAFSSL